MKPEQYKLIAQLDQELWLYRIRNKITFNTLSEYCNPGIALKVIDIGCGTGVLYPVFSRFGEVPGLDFAEIALEYSRQRGYPKLLKGSIENIPAENGTFDLLGAIDVIYHQSISRDDLALKECHRICKKDGIMVLTTPVFKFLINKQDADTGRRYRKQELRAKIENAGFKIERMTYLYRFLFPFVVILRSVKNFLNIKPKPDVYADFKKTPGWISSLLYHIVNIEAFLLKKLICPLEYPSYA